MIRVLWLAPLLVLLGCPGISRPSPATRAARAAARAETETPTPAPSGAAQPTPSPAAQPAPDASASPAPSAVADFLARVQALQARISQPPAGELTHEAWQETMDRLSATEDVGFGLVEQEGDQAEAVEGAMETLTDLRYRWVEREPR